MAETTPHPYIQFLKAHEKLLLCLGAGLLLIHLYGSSLNAWIDHDKRTASLDAQKVAADTTANKALSDQLAALQTQVNATTAALQKDIFNRNATTAKQQQTDATMTEVELAQRWAQLIKVKPEEVTTSSVPNNLQISDNAAHITVNDLEALPTCQANLADTATQLTGEKQIVAAQTADITGLNGQLVDEKKSHVADVNLEKAKAKRSFLRGFKWGAVAGFVGGWFVRGKI